MNTSLKLVPLLPSFFQFTFLFNYVLSLSLLFKVPYWFMNLHSRWMAVCGTLFTFYKRWYWNSTRNSMYNCMYARMRNWGYAGLQWHKIYKKIVWNLFSLLKGLKKTYTRTVRYTVIYAKKLGIKATTKRNVDKVPNILCACQCHCRVNVCYHPKIRDLVAVYL